MRKILIIMILGFIFSCSEKESDLEKIDSFNPDNKYLKANLISLHYMIETDKPSDIDSVFNNFIKNVSIPVTPEDCPDGVYTGRSPQDAFGFYHQVEIEIKDNKIIRVEYDEVNEEGLSKKKNKVYAQQMGKNGVTPAKAYNEMEKQLIEEQNYQEVDAITGATYSLYRFRYAVALALMKAKMKAR